MEAVRKERFQRMVGLRVQAARKQAGLSQEALSTRLGFNDRQILSHIETGVRAVSAEELVRLMGLLNKPLEFFTDRLRLVGEAEFCWRSRAEPALLDQFEGKAQQWIAAYRTWSEDFDMPVDPLLPTLNLPKRASYEDAADAAEKLRRAWGLAPEAPIRDVLACIEERLALLVLYVNAPESISGAACRLPDMNAILVNRSEVSGRRAFDFGHELFHLLTWREFPPERIDANGPGGPRSRREALADNFAAALLMPASTVRSRWGERGVTPVGEWLDRTAQQLGVSNQALFWRARNLGLLSDSDALEADAAANSGRSADEPAPPLFSRPFVERLHRALDGGFISRRRAADLLDCTQEEIDSLFRAHGLPEVYGG
jgi:Zn-dependent peptidase ImmA (M78 family)/DNA-binding XRE family transcriptional regulator